MSVGVVVPLPAYTLDPAFIAKKAEELGFESFWVPEHAGRDPSSIGILAFGHAGHFKSREQVQELREAGASRVTLWLEQTEGDGALAEMEALARQVL